MAKSARIDGQPGVTEQEIREIVPSAKAFTIRRGYSNRRILVFAKDLPGAIASLTEAGIVAHPYGSAEEIANRLVAGTA